MIQLFSTRLRILCYLLVAALLGTMFPLQGRAQDGVSKVDNVRVQISGNMVYIYYSLGGPPEQVYDVSLTMKSKKNTTFSYTPKNISGDVGPNVFTGTDWRITWNLSKEFPEGLKSNEYYFVVEAKVYADRVSSGGMSPVLLVAGGAVVIGGVVALLLLNKKDEGGIQPQSFPAPPGRP